MNATQQTNRAPMADDLAVLASFCSQAEWDRLITSHAFLAVVNTSLAETERLMSDRLGRKISVSQPSAKNSGDQTL